ncbi:MAG: transcription antitermination factor NusB [Acidimicrobiales bacterium]
MTAAAPVRSVVVANRERAVELLYEMTRKRDWTLDELLASLPLDPEPFTVTLLQAVVSSAGGDASMRLSRRTLGGVLSACRCSDLIVTRLAVAELITTDTPMGVVLAEAVDLAGRYSTDDSARYVNGVLSAVAHKRSCALNTGQARFTRPAGLTQGVGCSLWQVSTAVVKRKSVKRSKPLG